MPPVRRTEHRQASKLVDLTALSDLETAGAWAFYTLVKPLKISILEKNHQEGCYHRRPKTEDAICYLALHESQVVIPLRTSTCKCVSVPGGSTRSLLQVKCSMRS